MTDRAQQAADAIDSVAALTPHQARSVLNEYTKDDLIAAIATGHSQSVKCVTVGIDHTDIPISTGLVPLYLMPENETLIVTGPIICTETFDGTDASLSTFNAVQCFGPSGSGVAAYAVSDTFALDQTSASGAVDSLIFPAPPDVTMVLPFFPGASPVPGGGPVQLVLDLNQGNSPPLNSIGTQGHVDISLVLLVRS